MLSKTLLFLSTALLASSTPIIPRRILAGGPSEKPIPANCTVTNPLDSLAASSSASSTTTYMVSNATRSSAQLYSWYLNPDSVNNATGTGTWTECIEQCYGYGTSGSCLSAFMADNAPTPAGYYGTAGGDLDRGCLMFSRALTADDFVAAPEGQYTNAVAGDISCPSS